MVWLLFCEMMYTGERVREENERGKRGGEERQTDRQTERQRERQTERQTDRQTELGAVCRRASQRLE